MSPSFTKLASLQDATATCPTASGGVASLNPRLIADIPSGCRPVDVVHRVPMNPAKTSDEPPQTVRSEGSSHPTVTAISICMLDQPGFSDRRLVRSRARFTRFHSAALLSRSRPRAFRQRSFVGYFPVRHASMIRASSASVARCDPASWPLGAFSITDGATVTASDRGSPSALATDPPAVVIVSVPSEVVRWQHFKTCCCPEKLARRASFEVALFWISAPTGQP